LALCYVINGKIASQHTNFTEAFDRIRMIALDPWVQQQRSSKEHYCSSCFVIDTSRMFFKPHGWLILASFLSLIFIKHSFTCIKFLLVLCYVINDKIASQRTNFN